MDERNDFFHAELPNDVKGLRACLRCSLIKTFEQFLNRGCENCEFLSLEGNTPRVNECTTAYFEGMITLLEPNSSWVAKWQRLGNFTPGVYAIEVVGTLPEDAIDQCESLGCETRASAKASK